MGKLYSYFIYGRKKKQELELAIQLEEVTRGLVNLSSESQTKIIQMLFQKS